MYCLQYVNDDNMRIIVSKDNSPIIYLITSETNIIYHVSISCHTFYDIQYFPVIPIWDMKAAPFIILIFINMPSVYILWCITF